MANWINCRNEGSLHKKPDLHKQAMPGNGILETPIRDQGHLKLVIILLICVFHNRLESYKKFRIPYNTTYPKHL